MSHLVETMAYSGQTPWHTLGNALPAKQSIEEWSRAAGMQWHIRETPVRYITVDPANPVYGEALEFPEQKVLYRSDTKAPLSVVGNRYKVVQPREVLEFYRDLTEVAGFELETAGVLKAGRRFWALARTGKSTAIKGTDVVNSYLLLATSCDGSLATMAIPTSIRVVCNNTLALAVGGAGAGTIKVPHSRHFNADEVKSQLGIAVGQWDNFMYRMKMLAERRVKSHEAMHYFLKVICQRDHFDDRAAPLVNERALKAVQRLYDGHGRGAEMHAARNTAWGLLSSITEYVDHEKQAHNRDNRLDSAWFGQGAAIKQRALDEAMKLIA